MTRHTIVVGTLLTLLGVGSYLLLTITSGETPSPTALIPAFAGIPILLLGLLSLKDAYRPAALCVAAVLAALGFLLPTGRLAMQLVSGDEIAPAALASLILMAALSGTLLLLFGRSFFQRQRATS